MRGATVAASPSPTMTATAIAATASIAEVGRSHRAYLVRFAQRRLRDPMLAEDAVHDVFEAVLSGRAAFGGRAALRSWLTAVLKHKIVDAMRRAAAARVARRRRRRRRRRRPTASPARAAARRSRRAARSCWRGPWPASRRCRAALRDAMRLRVLDDRSTASACAELGISEENLFVRVHRARKQLLS